MAVGRWALKAVAVVIVAVAALQFVPLGRSPGNPPVVVEPQWDSAATRDLAKAACFDCHSNETEWPAYARLAPASWLVAKDVREGRTKLNFSEWQRPQEDAREAADKVREGDMPLWVYTVMHAHARLDATERDALARGLAASLGPGSGDERGEGERRER